ncbi:hypothetical protein GH877_29680, partial [Bacillus thuringiensis]|nr:hypothetical protein [Bacillus thuringiensis]
MSGPQIDLLLVGQMFTCAFLGAIMVFSIVRLAKRRRERQTLEIVTEPKPEMIPGDDDILLSKSNRTLSRSNRGRPLSARRRSGSNRSSAKTSSSRNAFGDSSATRVSRRSDPSLHDARSR